MLCSARVRPDGPMPMFVSLNVLVTKRQDLQVFETWGGKEQPSKQVKSPVLLPSKRLKTRQAAPGGAQQDLLACNHARCC